MALKKTTDTDNSKLCYDNYAYGNFCIGKKYALLNVSMMETKSANKPLLMKWTTATLLIRKDAAQHISTK